MKPVWIVDDDQSIRWVLERALTRAGIPMQSFAHAADVLDAFKHGMPSVLVSDIRMPGQDGLALLQDLKRDYPDLPVIIMTAFTDLNSTVSAFQKGAFDYLAKPFDINVAIALIRRAAQEHPRAGQEDIAPDGLSMQSLSPAMQEVFRAIGRLANSSVTVLITGESGTGKELIARALHTHSNRSEGPFVALNTAAIPKDLLEAELFGHERGAFTGATQLRHGRFEQARNGTLFLDEIGDMPFELQTRLLRVLSEGNFYRVGGSQAVSADVRIVAATHQPLEQRVSQGLFREDLFHRLNVIRLRLPALRDRKQDIPSLIELFLRDSAQKLDVPVRRLSPQALQRLIAFDYPGNIRQLENFCYWLTVMSASSFVDIQDLPPEVLQEQNGVSQADAPQLLHPAPATVGDASWADLLKTETSARLGRGEPALMATLTHDFERVLINTALEYSQGRRVQAAQRLGIGRNTLTRKCAELKLNDDGEQA